MRTLRIHPFKKLFSPLDSNVLNLSAESAALAIVEFAVGIEVAKVRGVLDGEIWQLAHSWVPLLDRHKLTVTLMGLLFHGWLLSSLALHSAHHPHP